MIGHEVAVPHLVQRLSDTSSHVRWSSARALTLIGVRDPSSIPTLRTLLKDEDKMVRLYAATALIGFRVRDDEVTAVIQGALDADDDHMVQAHALYMIGKLGNAAMWTVARIQSIAADSSSPEIRKAANETLLVFGQYSNRNGLANGSQPIHAETNRASSTAGSCR